MQVPARIEKLIAEKQYYAAVQLHVQSIMMLERGLQTVGFQLTISLFYFQCFVWKAYFLLRIVFVCLFFGRNSLLFKENANVTVS